MQLLEPSEQLTQHADNNTTPGAYTVPAATFARPPWASGAGSANLWGPQMFDPFGSWGPFTWPPFVGHPWSAFPFNPLNAGVQGVMPSASVSAGLSVLAPSASVAQPSSSVGMPAPAASNLSATMSQTKRRPRQRGFAGRSDFDSVDDLGSVAESEVSDGAVEVE